MNIFQLVQLAIKITHYNELNCPLIFNQLYGPWHYYFPYLEQIDNSILLVWKYNNNDR
jgi:hypothetical protein